MEKKLLKRLKERESPRFLFLRIFGKEKTKKQMANLSELPTAFECPAPSIAPGGTVALTLRPGLRGEDEPFELTVELLDEDEGGRCD